jgi:hypothetical protein
MVDNPLWEICERVAEVQALLYLHLALGSPEVTAELRALVEGDLGPSAA